MNWALYVAAMALLVVMAPVLGWWRLRSQWHRHPAGSAGVWRDQIVTRLPWALVVLAFTLYTALGGLGRIAAPVRDWMALGYAAVVLAVLACTGFLPPIMDARQRLSRLSKRSLDKAPANSVRRA